jgi:thiol-disulfide isomerase/thioredoxin
VWSITVALLVGFVGLTYLIPALWDRIPVARFAAQAQRQLGASARRTGVAGDVLTGLALGPVFSSCSPTYFVILAAVLPVSPLRGLAYLAVYALGLSLVLLGVSLLGQRFAHHIGWLANPQGWVRKGFGVLLLIIALGIGFGFDKSLQAHLAGLPIFSVLERFEQRILKRAEGEASTSALPEIEYQEQGQYKEITGSAGYLNSATSPTIGEHIGQRVVLIDFMTYSCINCQRTFPYLQQWYERYRDSGLVVIGIHTPEFAFEHKKENVARELGKFGITFPIILDNDYATWRAYENQFWPRTYLIDGTGTIVYDHIGEGSYALTEQAIRRALTENARLRGESLELPPALAQDVRQSITVRATPETYLGTERTRGLDSFAAACGMDGSCGTLPTDNVAVDASWQQEAESLVLTEAQGNIAVRFSGNALRIVAGAPTGATLAGFLDGKAIAPIRITDETLYEISTILTPEEHLFNGTMVGVGAEVFTLTFSDPLL